jgi:hypothetical protein
MRYISGQYTIYKTYFTSMWRIWDITLTNTPYIRDTSQINETCICDIYLYLNRSAICPLCTWVTWPCGHGLIVPCDILLGDVYVRPWLLRSDCNVLWKLFSRSLNCIVSYLTYMCTCTWNWYKVLIANVTPRLVNAACRYVWQDPLSIFIGS